MINHKIPVEILKLSRERVPAFFKLTTKQDHQTIAPGQVWSTYERYETPDGQSYETIEPRIVVILAVDEGCQVAPISTETSMATEFDLIVSGDASSLAFGFMIEIWNEVSLNRKQLRKLITELSHEYVQALVELYEAYLLDDELPANSHGLVGVPIMSKDDGRIQFQSEEIAAISYLARASTALLEVNMQENVDIQREMILPRPQLGRLRDFMRTTGIAVAADSSLDETLSSYIYHDKHNERILLEVFSSGRSPYSVWLRVHDLDPMLEGLFCAVELNTNSDSLLSEYVELRKNIKIDLGTLPGFEAGNVQSVILRVKEI